MAKTDWKMGDTVMPDDLNAIGQEINENASAIADHINATTDVHGATSAATPNTIVQRDADGRFKAAAPSASDDVARKAEVDAVQTNLNSHIADYVRQPGYAIASGSANTYSVTLSPAPTAYTEGMAIAVKINADSTGASTLNVNGLGAKAIKKSNGNDVSAGNLKAGSIYTLRYNGTNFILQGEGGAGTAQPADVLSGKTFTNDSGEQSGTMPNIGNSEVVVSTLNDNTLGKHNNIVSIVDRKVQGDNAMGVVFIPPKGYYDGVNSKINLRFWGIMPDVVRAGQRIGWNDSSAIVGSYTSDANATAADIISGKTAYVNGNKITGTMPNRGHYTDALSYYTTSQRLYIRIPTGAYVTPVPGLPDPEIIANDSNFRPENIRSGVSIFGLTGTLTEGRRSATGSSYVYSDRLYFSNHENILYNYCFITVTGLSFLPKAVLVYNENGLPVSYFSTEFPEYNGRKYGSVHGMPVAIYGNCYLNNGGFRVPVGNGNGYTCIWLAIE